MLGKKVKFEDALLAKMDAMVLAMQDSRAAKNECTFHSGGAPVTTHSCGTTTMQ